MKKNIIFLLVGILIGMVLVGSLANLQIRDLEREVAVLEDEQLRLFEKYSEYLGKYKTERYTRMNMSQKLYNLGYDTDEFQYDSEEEEQ